MRFDCTWLAVLVAVFAPTSASDARYLFIEGKEHIGAMVHLMEWSYEDIKNECSFLYNRGYTGILISPPVEHVVLDKCTWKERYMTISLKLESRSGTFEQLKEMMENCMRTNFRVFVDMNLNNMLKSTTSGEVQGIGGSKATPKKYLYEGITKDEFHKYCKLAANDMDDAEKVRICEVDDLQDLDNDSESLQKKQAAVMNQLIELGVSGFRIVMAKHMYPKHLKYLYLMLQECKKTMKIEKPLMIHDINDIEKGAVKAAEYTRIGTYTDYKFARMVSKYFLKVKDRKLETLLKYGDVVLDQPLKARETEPMVFLYNHITQHDPTLPYILAPEKGKPYRMAMAFMLSWPAGIPLILSSYKGDKGVPQKDGKILSPRPDGVKPDDDDYECILQYNCEHRDPFVWKMARFNSDTNSEPLTNLQSDNEQHWFAFSRGDRGFIFFNAGEHNQQITFKNLKMRPGEYCDVASGNKDFGICTGKRIYVSEEGETTITLEAKDPNGYVAIHDESMVLPHIKYIKNLMEKNDEVRDFVETGGKGLANFGVGISKRAKAVKEVFKDKDAGFGELLHAAAGDTGDMISSAGATAGGVAKSVATGAAHQLFGKGGGGVQHDGEGGAQHDADGAVTARIAAEGAADAKGPELTLVQKIFLHNK